MCNPDICMHTIRSRKMAKTFGNMFRLVRHKKIYQIEAPCMGCGEMLHPTVRFYNVCGIIDLFFIYAASILAMFAVHLGIPKDYILPIIVIAVSTQILDFTYDATGSPYSLTYTNGTADPVVYYYITNLQGDVVSLINASGDEVATYTYDPYGRPVTIKGRVGTTLQTITDPTHIANLNPLRYRGYYYDNETGFYYLQSRYYDPAICRFINADGYASTGQGFTGYNTSAGIYHCVKKVVSDFDEVLTREVPYAG